MDIKELIEELNSWKAPYAEITINGVGIKKIENIGANTFSIVPESDYPIDDRIEELENDIDEKDSEIRDLENEVGDYEDFVDDLKDDMQAAIDILEDILEDLEDEDPKNSKILKIIDKFEDDINKEIY
jgi:uncharacterized coiled-coil protein SlyX